MIKTKEIEELEDLCLDLLSKAYLDLGQHNVDAETKVMMAKSLAEDLKKSFGSLYFSDIRDAFWNGIRNTDDFVINAKTWYKWIKKWRDILWDAEYQVNTLNKNPKEVKYYRETPKLLKQ
jgi:hypothetical protein